MLSIQLSPGSQLTLPEDRGFPTPPGFMEAAWAQGMLTRGHKGPEDRVPSLEKPKTNRKGRKSPQMTVMQSTMEKHHRERSQQIPWKMRNHSPRKIGKCFGEREMQAESFRMEK